MSPIVRGDETRDNRGALAIVEFHDGGVRGIEGAIGQTLWLEI